MIPTVSVPNIQTPSPLMPSSFEGAPSQTSMQRIPFYAVPSTIAAPETYNNSKPITQFAVTSNASISSPVASIANNNSGSSSLFGSLLSAGSSLFMTQVMGQGGGSNISLVQSFFTSYVPSGPSISPETLEQFSLSKFLPSDASKPTPKPTGVANIAPIKAEASASVQQSVVQANQRLEQAQVTAVRILNTQAPSLATNSGTVVSSVTPEPALHSRSVNAQDRQVPSLIKPRGVSAYQSTQVRNTKQIDDVSENPIRVSL